MKVELAQLMQRAAMEWVKFHGLGWRFSPVVTLMRMVGCGHLSSCHFEPAELSACLPIAEKTL